jgi:type I restriction enzyme R subunit
MAFNEDSRVKIPTILHLCSLGYTYLPLSKAIWDKSTNIFTKIFEDNMKRLNPNMETADFRILLDSINIALDNEDLGKSFYEMLTNTSGHTLIDFENFSNNSLHVLTELPCINGDEEFRPDITLLINGLPLAFIEVKKPNNLNGIQAEYKRIQSRFKNKKFRKFINITQLMAFSNNMEYADDGSQPLQGAFYATTAYGDVKFNYFREEIKFDLTKLLHPISDDAEADILKDNNLVSIKNSQEFLTNRHPNTPTNRICTSLFQPERISFMLQYAIAYVKSDKGLEKHIMRYPQIFATKAIERKLNEGIKKGIIWHTQGSGKTALTYYNVKYLTHYFRDRNIVPKFYFIVDRLDLLVQAGKEFKSRGLIIHNINSRDEFVRDLKKTTALHNNSGKPEITVVNIQKFKEDRDVVSRNDYQINIQRVYFLDEVHRSYNPKGSFLANLNESDTNAIKIGLTGTPLLGNDYNSKLLFGDYIHKYYYNASIADGYTLRLIREEIETSYKFKLKQALEEIDIIKGQGDRKVVYAHPKFVEPLLDYIISDFEKSRITMNDCTIGAMVICDSSQQALDNFLCQ